MKEVRATRWVWVRLALGFLCLAVASACAPKAARRQTDIMEKTGVVSVSAVELRARVNDLADCLAGRLEQTADRISAETQDRFIRRRTLGIKVDGIPAVYTAAYRADPLAAAMDVWGFVFQISQFVDEEGAGRNMFKGQQPLVRERAREMLSEVDAFVQGIAIGPEAFADARAKVERWAKRHPLELNLATRPSIAAYLAELRAGDRDAFIAVGDVSDISRTSRSG